MCDHINVCSAHAPKEAPKWAETSAKMCYISILTYTFTIYLTYNTGEAFCKHQSYKQYRSMAGMKTCRNTREKLFLQNLVSSRDGPEKREETWHEMKEHIKKTTQHLQKIHSRCRVVFLLSFISCLLSVHFSGPFLLEMRFCRNTFSTFCFCFGRRGF